MTLVEKYRDRVIPVVIKEKISATDLILNVPVPAVSLGGCNIAVY